MENIDRYTDPNFVPNNDDILRARQRTTGSSVYTHRDDTNTLELTDVGGQYSERAKWEGFFTEKLIHAVIFFLAIDEYNVPNTEQRTEQYRTKFELSLSIFKELLCQGLVIEKNICRIVFLNKVDVFQEKLRDDKKWNEFKEFLDYNGNRSIGDCTRFIEEKMKDMAAEHQKRPESLTFHVTNALDTELMSKVSADIKTSIVADTLKNLGMI